MALSTSISGWQHCRPVISINGTSLMNKYGGTLLSASTPDANDQIFPLAFCIVDSENDSSWTWFCNQLKRIIGGRNEVVIVSDRHKSICKAIEVVFPNVLHCMCLVHLLRNLKLKYKRIVDTVFHAYACGKAFNIVNFEHEMRLLESSTPGIREELESISFAKWSHAYSPHKKYNVVTINISESLNSTMLKARELPICSMLKVLRMMLQRWFFERRNEPNYQVTDFTKTIEGILREQIKRSRSMMVNLVNNMKYQVIDGTS
ncbi:protein FAR1-RELATED SEQUENCE 3-like [Cucumis melo var. makuwa]|uniref:Protein FAR1-RELATED SEQUENCE 3-like n=1 Tax=Cucumis melo var. makuwa TaxID=1194695 RepID=A0A5A7TVG0_CUCMM|nr:protein FAR1-RELATED SEQUENCE 3-like [Cucumis melo var. makuwa]TYJ98646.1 protein FAR1-RELATED SEQUENCE 3-like [Cucumis melo var. makuwa]